MKYSLSVLFGAALLAVVAFTSFTPKSHAQKVNKSSVVLFIVGEGPNGSMQIFSKSAAGPGVPELDPDAAQSITRLLDAGYALRQDGIFFTFSR